MRFSLIDRITELQRGESIRAVKSLSLAEEYLQDHFPGFPIMPGVLMVEALVQTSAWLMRASDDFAYATVLMKEAKAVKFNKFVAPGQTLEITSSVHKRGDGVWTFKAAGEVAGESAVTARLTLEAVRISETARDDESQEFQINKMKELFAVLWQAPAAASQADSSEARSGT